MKNKILSSTQAAELCNLSITSIKRYIKSGKLNAFKTPGGTFKIKEKDLFFMMEEYNIPIPGEIEIVRRKILIVDDDEQVRESMARCIRLSGKHFETETANDGFEAGILVTQYKPDLIILDLMMPNMDGFSVCKKLKSNPLTKNVLIMVLTGFGTEENIQRALDCGADVVLAKPTEDEELLKGIETLFR